MRATWARKATLRKSGHMMRDLTIKVALHREDFAIVVAYRSGYGRIPASRKDLQESVADFVAEKGRPDYTHIEELYKHDEAMTEAYAIVDRLMPELVSPQRI